MDIQTSDDPVWTYFDSQHTYIIKQMNTSYKTAVASIRGLRPSCLCPRYLLTVLLASLEKSEPDVATPDNLTSILAAQLQIAIHALDNKQSDAAVG